MQATHINTVADSSSFRQFLLAQIKVEALQFRLRAAEAVEIGYALSLGAITTTDAIAEMVALGASLTIPSTSGGGS